MRRTKTLFNFFIDEIEVIENRIREMTKNFVYFIIDSKFDEIREFWTINKYIRNSGQAYLQESDIDDKIKRSIFAAGYSEAVLDIMQMYLEKLSEEKEIEQVKTKYRDSIFQILAERRTLFHGDLAKELKVSVSSLNDIIKHMNASNVQLINVERVSKFTLYSLTPIAYQYYIKNKCRTLPPKPTKKIEPENTYIIKRSVSYEVPEVEVKGLKLPIREESDINSKKISGLSIPNKNKIKKKAKIYDFPYRYELERMKI